MRVGIFISECWGPGSTIEETRARAVRAEALGFPSGWVPYLPWSLDSLASLQAAGEVTERIELGSAVIPTYFFHPIALARQAATVQAAVGRPLHLGIGCSNPAIVEMHGLDFERPARHVREYVEILAEGISVGARPQGAREQAGWVRRSGGDFFSVETIYGTPGATALGSILVGALGPQMLRVTGRVSDGLIATWSDERVIEKELGPAVRGAAREAGRPEPTIAGVIPTAIVPKSRVAAAREAAQSQFGFYEAVMPYKRVVDASEHDRIADIAVIGDEAEVARRLQRFKEAGKTDFLAAPVAVEGATWDSTAEKLAPMARALCG